jgi:hypothetical protein
MKCALPSGIRCNYVFLASSIVDDSGESERHAFFIHAGIFKFTLDQGVIFSDDFAILEESNIRKGVSSQLIDD